MDAQEKRRLSEAAVIPTDILWVECNSCGQRYQRKSEGGTGLPIDRKRDRFLPCTGIPGAKMLLQLKDVEDLTQEQQDAIDRRLGNQEPCGSKSYTVYRKMDVVAAPTGTWAVDLSRKRN
jgi:hypothetical protein